MHVEFRQQTYSWSLAELALTIGLVEVGGLWTTVAWVVAMAALLSVQGTYSPAKVLFNLALAVLHGTVAVAVLLVLPPVVVTEPLGWISLILAVLVANLVGALAFSVAVIGTSGYPGPQLWREQLVPIAVVSPVVVSVGIMVLLLSTLSSWAWVLVLPVLTVVGPALPSVRPGGPRGQQRRARLRLRAAGGAGLPGRGRHAADRRGRPGAAQRGARGALAAALPRRGAAAGRLLRERRRLVRRPGRLRRRLPPARGLLRRPAAGLAGAGRRGGGAGARPPRGLRPARRAGHDRGGGAGLPRGVRPPQRDRLVRRQRPGRAGLDAHPRQRGHPAPAAAHPDPLRRRPRPAHRAAQPSAPGRRDRPAAHRRPGRARGPG